MICYFSRFCGLAGWLGPVHRVTYAAAFSWRVRWAGLPKAISPHLEAGAGCRHLCFPPSGLKVPGGGEIGSPSVEKCGRVLTFHTACASGEGLCGQGQPTTLGCVLLLSLVQRVASMLQARKHQPQNVQSSSEENSRDNGGALFLSRGKAQAALRQKWFRRARLKM